MTLITAAAVTLAMFCLWLLSLRLHDVSVVDPAWGPTFVVVAVAATLAGRYDAQLRWLLLGLTAIWGVRLGWHLTRRKLSARQEDRRYAAMRQRHVARFPLWSLVMVFGLYCCFSVRS